MRFIQINFCTQFHRFAPINRDCCSSPFIFGAYNQRLVYVRESFNVAAMLQRFLFGQKDVMCDVKNSRSTRLVFQRP